MTGNEIEELNEIRQVVDGVLLRLDNAYRELNSDEKDKGFNNVAQSVKTLLNIKTRMEILASCTFNRNPHASDSGAYM